MYKIQTTIFAVLLFIAACDQQKTSEKNGTSDVPEIVREEIAESIDNCIPDSLSCTRVNISYPVLSDSTKEKLNKLILDYVRSPLSAYADEEAGTGGIRQTVSAFLNDYTKFKSDFPDYTIGWYIVIQADILYNADGLFSFRVDTETFTGGAHPNASSNFVIADANTARILETKDIISDTVAFKKMLETAFRESKGLKPETSFADAGYYINDGDFVLNNNIGMTEDKIFVHYNPYEIAPYSLGPTTIELEKDQISNLLRIK